MSLPPKYIITYTQDGLTFLCTSFAHLTFYRGRIDNEDIDVSLFATEKNARKAIRDMVACEWAISAGTYTSGGQWSPVDFIKVDCFEDKTEYANRFAVVPVFLVPQWDLAK